MEGYEYAYETARGGPGVEMETGRDESELGGCDGAIELGGQTLCRVRGSNVGGGEGVARGVDDGEEADLDRMEKTKTREQSPTWSVP